MSTKATLKPGQNGTKRLIEKYGSRLVCVRYRYDTASGRRYTTVELIEEESDWGVASPIPAQQPAHQPTERLGVRIEYWEAELRNRVKEVGGIWRPRHKLWELSYENVVALGLESRVVADQGALTTVAQGQNAYM
jgi:hypothetical protein